MPHLVERLAPQPPRAGRPALGQRSTFRTTARATFALFAWLLPWSLLTSNATADEARRVAGTNSATEAQLVVQDTTSRVLAALSRDRARVLDQPSAAVAIVKEIVMPNVDLDRVSLLVLGKHWQRASRTQRERFKREFGMQLLRTYVIGVADYLALSDKLGTGISYLAPSANDERSEAIVRTEVGRSAMQVRIDYRLYRSDDAWKVVDVLVEGVSAVTTFRRSFIAETSRHGIDSLIDRIAAKNRQFGPA